MTTVLPDQPTVAADFTSMLREIGEVLARYRAEGAVALIVRGPGLDPPHGQVLVQRVNPITSITELVPRPVTDLRPGDVVHAPLDPADAAFLAYAENPQARVCWPTRDGHHYS